MTTPIPFHRTDTAPTPHGGRLEAHLGHDFAERVLLDGMRPLPVVADALSGPLLGFADVRVITADGHCAITLDITPIHDTPLVIESHDLVWFPLDRDELGQISRVYLQALVVRLA